MTSRREFFRASSITLSAIVTETASAKMRSEGQHPSPTALKRDYWNDLPNHMIAKVHSARGKRKAELAEVKSRLQAEERIAFIRAKTWELIGGKPDETPLNPKVTGVIERDAYRIEKVIFESQPEFYVTAHLYVPKAGNDKYPGILAPVGHAPDGKTYVSYQTLFQNLARQGFMVLAWEPPGQGERLQYLDATNKRSLYEPTGEHDRFGWPALLIGSTTTQFEVWDGVRALDYLLSRPEIDAQRIGCCGHSGGGTQTMFLCALEPRIHAAVAVEGHTENLAGAEYQPPGAYADAEQNLIGSLNIPLDRGDLLAAFTPKPLLICYTPIDNGTTYSPTYVESTKEIVGELKGMYRLYGAEEKVSLANSPLPHDYDYFQRRSTYAWFNKWLLSGQRAAEEVSFEDAPESSLWCTPTGQVLTSIGGRAAFQVNYDRLRTAKAASTGQRTKKDIQRDLREVLHLPAETARLNATSLSSNKYKSVIVEEVEYESEPGIRVPGWVVKPATGGPQFPVAVVIDDDGKDRIFDQWPLIDDCARAGVAICSVDIRTIAVTRPRLPASSPSFYGYDVELAYSLVNLSLGAPIIGQQTWDILRCLDYLETRSDVDPKRIGLYGTGVSGLPCIMASTLDDRINSLLLSRTLVDFQCIVASKDYVLPLSAVAFGILKKFDLPDLCAYLVPRPFWLINAVGPKGTGLSASEVRDRYETVTESYASAAKQEQFVSREEVRPMDAVVAEWLRKVVV